MQLRDLVPPQSKDSASSQDNLDPTKRPKHVVLSDTIMLVKNLQLKVRLIVRPSSPAQGRELQHTHFHSKTLVS